MLESDNYDLVILDMNFKAGINSGNEGLFWLREIMSRDSDISVVMITAYGDVELAVKAVREGATDFVLKPWENEKLLATLKSALRLRKSKLEVSILKSEKRNLKRSINSEIKKSIIGSSKPVLEMMKVIEKVSDTDASVLITGENGTGKELVAAEIHRRSSRKNELMVTVDMGAIAETLFESELFGHAKGSFTDAHEDRAGKIEIASGGTLFLDEIGNLSLPLQAKLLTALQNRVITRVGSNRPVNVNIRLICATNRDLVQMASDGLFREDLLYRINTIHIEVPPLRERLTDIPVLAEFFLRKYREKYSRHGIMLKQDGIDALVEYSWPGNVRELQHTIEKAVILNDAGTIGREELMLKTPSHGVFDSSAMTLEEMEKQMIMEALTQHNGNMSSVANQLGVTRQTLYNKIRKYDL
jgi:DNA-binding NtrC family response regulator